MVVGGSTGAGQVDAREQPRRGGGERRGRAPADDTRARARLQPRRRALVRGRPRAAGALAHDRRRGRRAWARARATAALPAGLALLDSPDIDSVAAENRALAAQLLAAADFWLFVTTAARYADAVPWELLHAARDRGTALAVVLNRVPTDGADRGERAPRADARRARPRGDGAARRRRRRGSTTGCSRRRRSRPYATGWTGSRPTRRRARR